MLLYLNMFFFFCFSSSKHNIIVLLNCTCVEFISIKYLWENHTIILVFHKVTQLVARALVAVKRKKKLVKPQHWHFLIIWKRSNKIKAIKTGITLKGLCHWRSQISELMRSVLKILSFWNKFWIILCLLWLQKKKKGHQAHKTFSDSAEYHFDNYVTSNKELDLYMNLK